MSSLKFEDVVTIKSESDETPSKETDVIYVKICWPKEIEVVDHIIDPLHLLRKKSRQIPESQGENPKGNNMEELIESKSSSPQLQNNFNTSHTIDHSKIVTSTVTITFPFLEST
jgi:hypothetical protein